MILTAPFLRKLHMAKYTMVNGKIDEIYSNNSPKIQI